MSSQHAAPPTLTLAPDVVVFRHYNTPHRASVAHQWRKIFRNRLFFVAKNSALALAVKADGLHYPQHQLKNGRPVMRPKPHWWVSAAAHDEPSVLKAIRAGADFIFLSPVFQTYKGKPLGVVRFAKLACRSKGCMVALGGVKKNHWRRLAHAGAVGLAGIRLF